MMAIEYRKVETVTRRAPFGLAFWDPAAGHPVSDGLAVKVFRAPATRPSDAVASPPNRSGVFVAHDLTGSRAFDPALDDEGSSPAPPYLVEVRDLYERYLPFVMQIASAGAGGFAVPPCAADLPGTSPMSPPVMRYVPLFIAPSYRAPAGLAVVRASIVDGATGLAAAHAVIEVRESGRLVARGMADIKGQVAAAFAYPEMSGPPTWSPPGAAPARVRTVDQKWMLDVKVRFRRDLALYAPGGYTPRKERPALPDLCDVVQQPVVSVSTLSPPVVLGSVDLSYGEELILGADPSAAPGASVDAQLWIDPA
jgi:hypothetical protein